jgi:hypothetical protein
MNPPDMSLFRELLTDYRNLCVQVFVHDGEYLNCSFHGICLKLQTLLSWTQRQKWKYRIYIWVCILSLKFRMFQTNV